MEALAWAWSEQALTILIILVVAILGRLALVRTIRKLTKSAAARARARRDGATSRADQILAAAAFGSDERHEQRTKTIGALLSSLTTATIWVIALLTILAVVNVPLAPLLASAGVGGIALAFGAQSLVKDFLSGIFMIMEDQFGVGDLVDTGEVQGTVEDIGLRVTRVRDGSGTVWYVRNGEILRIGNQSQGWSTATVDVPVAYDEDPDQVIQILEEVAKAAEEAPEFANILLERPKVVGVNAVGAASMTIRILAKTTPNQHWAVQRWLLAQSMAALSKAGVQSPATSYGVLPSEQPNPGQQKKR